MRKMRANGATAPCQIDAVVPDNDIRLGKLLILFLANMCPNIFWKKKFSILRSYFAESNYLLVPFILRHPVSSSFWGENLRPKLRPKKASAEKIRRSAEAKATVAH